MSATSLVRSLERRGVRLQAVDDRLVVDAPRGVLTDDVKEELRAQKSEVLRIVREGRPLAELAADRLPSIRFTIRETGDTERDFDLIGRVRQVIEEFQPGGNHIYLTIVTLDQRRVVVEWRAVADRELRLGIGHVLARGGCVCVATLDLGGVGEARSEASADKREAAAGHAAQAPDARRRTRRRLGHPDVPA
ncbi:MAG: hypothetical protein WEB52_13635 [Dehalococcoidia bacterium]